MSRWLTRLAVLSLLASVIALVFETRGMAEMVGDAERKASQASARAKSAEQQLSDILESRPSSDGDLAEPAATAGQSSAGVDLDLNDFSRLQIDLHTTRQQLQSMRLLLAEQKSESERRAKASAERAAQSLKPMPQGVRVCLEALHDCLRAEGFHNQRFLSALSLDDEGLHEVELLDTSSDGLGVAFLTAKRMTADLDRATARLVLSFFDGYRSFDGERAALPEDGLQLAFAEVDGRMLEERLPFLIKGQGAYPIAASKFDRPKTDVDPATRRQWLARIERVLDQAKMDLKWRVTRLRGMQDGYFLTVEMVGTNDKNLVMAASSCARMAVEVDDRSGVVSVLLTDGVLQRDGVQSTISSEGYRMLLPGLKPKETIDAMLGMVVRK